MARPERPERKERMTQEELEEFKTALAELESRVTTFLAENTDETAEDLDQAVDEYEQPEYDPDD